MPKEDQTKSVEFTPVGPHAMVDLALLWYVLESSNLAAR